jgi:transcriptional regulator with XRE-family HTH domain
MADTFDAVLRDVVHQMGWKQHELAQRLSVSPKTIGRYLSGKVMPPLARRHGMVHALRDIPRPLLTRVTTSLQVSDDFSAELPRPHRDPELARPGLEAAVIEVAEKVDSGPVRVRRALVLFLTRLIEADVDAKTAKELIASR